MLLASTVMVAGLWWSGVDRRLLQADTAGYIWCAQTLNAGELYPSDNFYPGYPYLLALLLPGFGADLFAVHFFPWLLGGLVPLLIFLLGMNLWERGEQVGLAAAAIYMLWPLQQACMNVPLTEPIFAFIACLGILFFSLIPRHPTFHVGFFLCMALGALVRYDIVVLAVTTGVAWLFLYGRCRRCWGWAGLGTVLGVVALTPFFHANWLRYYLETGQRRLLAALPFVKAQAWIDVTSAQGAGDRMTSGIHEAAGAVGQIRDVAGFWLLTLLAVLLIGGFGVCGLASIRKSRGPTLLYGIAASVAVYALLLVFVIQSSLLRHASRLTPFAALLAGAGSIQALHCLRDLLRPLPLRKQAWIWGGAGALLVLATWGALDLSRNYLAYRGDVARASIVHMLARPYDLTPVVNRMLVDDEEAGCTHSNWLEYLMVEMKLQHHFNAQEWPPPLPPEDLAAVDGHFDLHWGESTNRKDSVRAHLEGDMDAVQYQAYPGFLGVMGEEREAEIIVRLGFDRPIQSLILADSHLAAFWGASVQAEISWDAGKHWNLLYAHDAKAIFPHTASHRLHPSSGAALQVWIRYRFSTSRNPRALAGLMGCLRAGFMFAPPGVGGLGQ